MSMLQTSFVIDVLAAALGRSDTVASDARLPRPRVGGPRGRWASYQADVSDNKRGGAEPTGA